MKVKAKPAPIERDYAAIARQYCVDVIKGTVPAGELVQMACARHLKDLKSQLSPAYPYQFDSVKAGRPCEFAENLPHTKGEWAKRKESIKLQPWQVFQLACLFGWVQKAATDGVHLRRFTEYYGEIPRKNGKSILAAVVGLFMLTLDGEFGPEVYSGASTEKQAWEVFRPAKQMVERTPQLAEAFGMDTYAKSIVTLEDAGRFEPLIGKPGDGAGPSCAIVDEFHEHDTPDLIDTMQTGMGARRQPITFIITTAGYNLAGPCHDKRTQAVHMLNGSLENETLFACIFTIDEKDDWTDPKVLRKANPNFGVSVMEGYLLGKQREAVLNVSQQNRFKTKHLNVWCSAKAALFNLQKWQLATDRDLKIEELKGEDCWFSLDLASKSDMCAYIKLFRKVVDGNEAKPHYYLFGRYYLPEDAMGEEAGINGPAYQRWSAAGILTLTNGATVDYDHIQEDVEKDIKKYKPKEIVYDPFNALQMAQGFMDSGPEVVEFIQTPQNFAVPIDEIQSALKEARLHHNGCPILTWMIANCVGRPAKKGLMAPVKEKPENKIDGVVALAMAIARASALNDDGGLGRWIGSGENEKEAA